ncbi:hypothetical protein [Lamprobacter modestohalophilus]|uniref:hypothetical protein n=1 Tax=Lamprobacter modestohalophilus TaxID=1064514 RepID=UPI002ADEAB1B|nr:hypothetical protein [Lamprobacter modestohalophilus]
MSSWVSPRSRCLLAAPLFERLRPQIESGKLGDSGIETLNGVLLLGNQGSRARSISGSKT